MEDARKPVRFTRTGLLRLQEDGSFIIDTGNVENLKNEVGHMKGSLVRFTIEQLPDSPSAAH